MNQVPKLVGHYGNFSSAALVSGPHCSLFGIWPSLFTYLYTGTVTMYKTQKAWYGYSEHFDCY